MEENMDVSTKECNIFSLPNELHDYILSFLNFSHLKKLRLTCKHFDNVVVESSVFRELAEITIRIWQISDIVEYIRRNNNRLSFRNVKFCDVDDSPEVAYILNAMAMDVKKLTLDYPIAFKTFFSVCLQNLEELNVTSETSRGWTNSSLSAYKKLNSLHFFSDYICAEMKALKGLSKFQAGRIKSLKISCMDEDFLLEVLNLNAESLKYLDICFEYRLHKFNEEWENLFQNMNALETLKFSGPYFLIDWCDEKLKALPETVKLNCIALRNSKNISDDLLMFIAKRFQNSLQEADFSSSRSITSRGLEEMLRTAHNLKKLDLSECSILNCESFGLDRKVMLQELNLSYSKLTENSICRLAENFTNLVVLSLSSCDGCTDKALAYIFCYQTRLRTLNLRSCDQITDSGLMGLGEKEWPIPMPISRLQDLESLNLDRVSKLTNKPFYEVMTFKKLSFVELGINRQITNEAIEFLTKNCPSIEKLNLKQCEQLTADVFDIMAINLKNLSEFSIHKKGREITGRDDFRKYLKSLKEKFLSYN